MNGRLKELLGIDGNPIINLGKGEYEAVFDISARKDAKAPQSDLSEPLVKISGPIINGGVEDWQLVTFLLKDDGEIELHMEGSIEDGYSTSKIIEDHSISIVPVEEHFSLQMLGLADSNNKPNAKGKLFINILRNDGNLLIKTDGNQLRSRRSLAEDNPRELEDTLMELGELLMEKFNASQYPFEMNKKGRYCSLFKAARKKTHPCN